MHSSLLSVIFDCLASVSVSVWQLQLSVFDNCFLSVCVSIWQLLFVSVCQYLTVTFCQFVSVLNSWFLSVCVRILQSLLVSLCQYLTVFFVSCFLSVCVSIWQLLPWCTTLTWQLSILCSHTGVIFCSVWWISHWKNEIKSLYCVYTLNHDFIIIHVRKKHFYINKFLFLAFLLYLSTT